RDIANRMRSRGSWIVALLLCTDWLGITTLTCSSTSSDTRSKMSGMTYWVVRHAEREDNISSAWRRNSSLKSDNSPLSKRGQADEISKRFDDIELDHVIVSPFDRCLETATRILRNRSIPIKVEPGLVEALYLCEDPPGYESLEILKQKYPLVDTSYDSVMPWKLPREGYGDDACTPRVQKTLEGLAEKFPGATLLLVSHGAPIGAIHELLGGNWKYVGQATVSKFVEVKPGKFKKELSSDASHLSDKSNLRPW
uniref:Phosphoglycerate mutase n=1 Tax=Parascaris univalens TaxID=6257 RepID=A0A915AZ42_PARUN